MQDSTCKAPAAKATCAKTEMTAVDACPDPNYVDSNRTLVCSCQDFKAGTCSHVPLLTSETNNLARWWMVQSYAPCCNFAGTGKPCSSGQPCLPTEFSSSKEMRASSQTNAYLGDGALTRRPRVVSSSRPTGIKGGDFTQKMSSLKSKRMGQSSASYVPKSSWVQVCIDGLVHSNDCPVIMTNPKQPGANWFKARFGHALVVVSGVRVVIYGGFSCYNESCREYVALRDTWELDLNLVQSTTEALMMLRELSPTGSLVGGVVGVSAGASSRVYVTGGSRSPFALEMISGIQSRTVPDAVEARELLVFELKMRSLRSTHWPAVSGHSAVANASQAILFGGYIGNTLTSAVFNYYFTAPTGDSAFSQVNIMGQLPESRGYCAMNILGSETFLIAGGIKSMMNDSGIGFKRVGLGDIWTYSFVTGKWNQKQGLGNYTVNAFGASANFRLQGLFVFLSHGGVSEEYVPGLTGKKVWRDEATNPFPYGPGRRQPTSEMKVYMQIFSCSVCHSVHLYFLPLFVMSV